MSVDFAKGATGPAQVYNIGPGALETLPAGLVPGQSAGAAGLTVNSLITGEIGSGGTVAQGGGFSSVRGSVGFYTVTFDTPFPIPPTVLVTPAGVENVVVILSSISGAAFSVILTDADSSTHVDSVFNFLAFATQ